MNLAERIEHTKLAPGLSQDSIKQLCDEAAEHGFRGVCIPPTMIKAAKANLEGNAQKVVTVVDFPYGYSHTSAKVESIKKACDAGADSVDVVINYTAAMNSEWSYLQNEIESVVQAARMRDTEIKLIIELGAYPSKVLARICEICLETSPDFVKTNTGINHRVDLQHLKLMRRLLGADMKIKASGGINNNAYAMELINEGASVLGSSSSIDLI